MQIEIIDFLYENFILFIIGICVLLVIIIIIMVNFAMSKITTQVLELQTNSAVFFKSKEDSDAEKIRYNNRIVIRESEPYIVKTGIMSYIRLFFVRQGQEFTSDFPQRYMSKITLNNIKQAIIEGLQDEKTPTKIAEKVLSLRQSDLADDKEKRDWNIIFESEAIKQGVAGLLASQKMELFKILVGVGIGLLIRAIMDFIASVI